MRPNVLAVMRASRRVEISFDREREAFRAVTDAVARVSGRAPRRLDAPRSRLPRANIARLVGTDPTAGKAAGRLPLDDRPQPLAGDGSTTKAARYLGALVAAYGPLPPDDAATLGTPLVDLLVLDATALAALARGNLRARAQLARAVGALARIVVPATALVDALHQRVAEAVGTIVTIDRPIAHEAARLLLAKPGTSATAALAIACTMHARSAAILSSEGAALEPLARMSRRSDLYVFAI